MPSRDAMATPDRAINLPIVSAGEISVRLDTLPPSCRIAPRASEGAGDADSIVLPLARTERLPQPRVQGGSSGMHPPRLCLAALSVAPSDPTCCRVRATSHRVRPWCILGTVCVHASSWTISPMRSCSSSCRALPRRCQGRSTSSRPSAYSSWTWRRSHSCSPLPLWAWDCVTCLRPRSASRLSAPLQDRRVSGGGEGSAFLPDSAVLIGGCCVEIALLHSWEVAHGSLPSSLGLSSLCSTRASGPPPSRTARREAAPSSRQR